MEAGGVVRRNRPDLRPAGQADRREAEQEVFDPGSQPFPGNQQMVAEADARASYLNTWQNPRSMAEPTQHSLSGSAGNLVFFEWPNPDATFIALISHGYGEHARRYDHVADRLVAEGATVYAPDHMGHGLSEGERALVAQGEAITADLHLVTEVARGAHPGLPLVLIGHSMGGIVATRFAQRHPGELEALVLSGPVIGGNSAIFALLEMEPIPEVPIDP